jgi:hypothetical protein
MSFASPVFLWYFMPAVLGALWLAPLRARNAIVAGASLGFQQNRVAERRFWSRERGSILETPFLNSLDTALSKGSPERAL